MPAMCLGCVEQKTAEEAAKAAERAAKAAEAASKPINQLSLKELKQELTTLGISFNTFVEKGEFREALNKARGEGEESVDIPSTSEEWEPIAENEPTSLVGEWLGGANLLRIRLGPGGLEISAGGANNEVMRLMEVSSGEYLDTTPWAREQRAQSSGLQRWIATDANSVPVYQVEPVQRSRCIKWQRLLIRHVDDGDEAEFVQFFRIGRGAL